MTIPMQQTDSEISRRSFLQRTGAVATLAAPYFVPATVFGASAPSNRINVAFIGVGNQGTFNLAKFMAHSDCQVVAVCDVNRMSGGYKEPEDVRGREPAKQIVEQYYTEKRDLSQYKGCN